MNRILRTSVGVCLISAAVFVFTASFSYLLHWREDMSALFGTSGDIANICGAAGLRVGHFFIGQCFGLASFVLSALLIGISVNLFSDERKIPVLKTTFVTLGVTMLLSLALAFCGSLCNVPNAFGGGFGGRFGAYLSNSIVELTGAAIAGILIFVAIFCFAFLCSSGFSRWFRGLFPSTTTEPEVVETASVEQGPAPVFVEKPMSKPDCAVESPTEQFFSGMTGSGAEASSTKETVETPEENQECRNFEVVSGGDLLSTTVEKDLPPIDNRMDVNNGGLPKFKRFPLTLLEDYKASRQDVSTEELQRNNNRIRTVLGNYKVQIVDIKALVGPTVTLYKVYPAPGVRVADIKKLQEDIAVSLGAKGVRVVVLNDCVGIEVANDYPSMVPLKALLNSDTFRDSKADLPVAIGYTITREVKVFDLADAPHLLIAGATKQGKSVGLNVIVGSLLNHCHPSELKFVFIDPKMVEFSAYSNLLHHYLAVLPDAENDENERERAIVKNPKDAEKVLRSLCIEMDDRYKLLSKAGVNNLRHYNEKFKERKLRPDQGHRFLPYLVTIVDEYADLTMMTGASPEARTAARSITTSIIRLAQKGRAAGLHVILATQRPSVDVVSGMIKSNFPMRIAFRVASKVDSQTILDNPGAEKLIGKGDMLLSAGIDSERIQCGYVSGDEIDKIAEFIQEQQGYGKSYNTPYYLPEPAEATSEAGGAAIDMTNVDERFEEAARMVVTTQRGSTSDLQRRLGMGYAKAGKVMDQLEGAGIVGPQDGSKPRQVLIPDLDTLEPIIRAYRK